MIPRRLDALSDNRGFEETRGWLLVDVRYIREQLTFGTSVILVFSSGLLSETEDTRALLLLSEANVIATVSNGKQLKRQVGGICKLSNRQDNL